ncbi:hypothetical protein D3C73_1244410 [compost metagenome]
MADSRKDIEFNMESCGAKLAGSHRRCHRRNRAIILPVQQQYRCPFTVRGNLHRCEKPCEGDKRAHVPAAGSDGIKRDDGTLRNANEGDTLVGAFEPFFPDDVSDDLVEAFTRGSNVFGSKRIAVDTEPLVTAPVGERSIGGGEAALRKCRTP